MELVNIAGGNRVNKTGAKTQLHRPADIFRADRKNALAADRVIDRRVRSVQTEAEKIQFSRPDLLQEIVKKIAVGIHGDSIAHGLGRPDNSSQIRMKGRLTAEQDEIAVLRRPGKETQPFQHGVCGQSFCSMLGRIDIAMLTGEVAGCEQMKKDISLTGLEVNRPCGEVGGHGAAPLIPDY